MSRTPTTERTTPQESSDRASAIFIGSRSGLTNPGKSNRAEADDSFSQGLLESIPREFDMKPECDRSVFEGVRRAAITPPSNPVGGDCTSESEHDTDATDLMNDADASDMIKTLQPAVGSIADLFSSSSDHSEAEDIILCEPPAAHLAMLSLRLPTRATRRSIPSFNKGAADCGAHLPFRPLIPLEKNGANGDLIQDAASATCTVATERKIVSAVPVELASTASVGTLPSKQMPELPPRGEIARLGARRQGGAPRRIGSGALVPAKLTWMPKDPFGNGIRKQSTSRFRWELMLTAACITAGCGLAGVWLLRSIFA